MTDLHPGDSWGWWDWGPLFNSQAPVDPILTLPQYGIFGIFLFCAITATIVLFRREAKALDLAREENAQLRDDLKALNATVQEKYLTTLASATQAISEAVIANRRP